MQTVIKDSANNYVLYVDRGLDFNFSVAISSFNLSQQDFANSEFYGAIKVNGKSLLKIYELSIEKTSNQISITIPSDLSVLLTKTKYSFDVIYTLNNKKYKAIYGTIQIRDNVAV